MLAKILPECIYNILHIYISIKCLILVEKNKQKIVTREDNYELLKMKN